MKKQLKNLNLSKKTVTILNEDEQKQVVGGDRKSHFLCSWASACQSESCKTIVCIPTAI